MANGHIRNLLSLEGTIIAAICDVNESAVKSKGEELGLPEHKRYRKYEILKNCIEAGKPVLSEKPFTRTMEEAEELLCIIPRTLRTVHDRVH
ncbi:Gfo/Idh/MocA family oxidoreductase [Paenibacillus sp. OAS669]|uniref:Gfo/Idh/MocA family oxidoreductase n=1 Tax=Paenibacillus sp. OAS669 TaxID=2663821 RepID=UPI00178A3577|nr:Gfo/Idh/MocA family oxidoreductase [Paenibacillus sp. OAS669]